jgi:hypothetical protein
MTSCRDKEALSLPLLELVKKCGGVITEMVCLFEIEFLHVACPIA